MPRAKKQPYEVADKRNGAALRLAAPPSEPPAMPAGLKTTGKRAWTVYWESPMASIATDIDLPAITRYCNALDEHALVTRQFQAERLVVGSTGQPTLNPLAKWLTSLKAEIGTLETQLGLTPLARMKLGVAYGEASKSLADKNQIFVEENGYDGFDADAVYTIDSD